MPLWDYRCFVYQVWSNDVLKSLGHYILYKVTVSGNFEQLTIIIMLLSTITYRHIFKNKLLHVYYFYHYFFVFHFFKNLSFWYSNMKPMQTLFYEELFPRATINSFSHSGITPEVKLECYQNQYIYMGKGHFYANVSMGLTTLLPFKCLFCTCTHTYGRNSAQMKSCNTVGRSAALK